MVTRFILSYLLFSIVGLAQSATTTVVPTNLQTAVQPVYTPEQTSFSTHHKISMAVQEKNPEEELFMLFLQPIKFTPEGIEYYFTHIYNHQHYPDHLALNMNAMQEFLEYGKKQGQDTLFAQSIVKLFLQKIKACSCINAYAFTKHLTDMKAPLTYFLEKKESSFWITLQKTIKDTLTNTFSLNFTAFKQEPDKFLTDLSAQLAKQTDTTQTQAHVHTEQVRKDLLRFIELSCNKLVWSPEDGYDAWLNMNALACVCYDYYKLGLISDIESFDDICWSLIHRFCYFLTLAHDDISDNVITQIIDDVQKKQLALLMVEEQEDYILSKKEWLLQKLTATRTQKSQDLALNQNPAFSAPLSL